MRTGNKQKKIDINVPSLTDFVHKVYINSARKIYTNIYLFEKNISPLQIQKHNRELELIIREQILDTIRDNIPVENILKVYLDESIEEDVQVEESEEIISTEPIIEESNEDGKEGDKDAIDDDEESPTTDDENRHKSELRIDPLEPLDTLNSVGNSDSNGKIQFNDIDNAISTTNEIESISAPKNVERLEQLSNERHEARKLEEDEDDEDEKISIGDRINLTELDVHDLEKPKELNKVPIGLEEIEVLT